MDGVITSEECYWDAASLTVWELLYSKRYLGLKPEPALPPFRTDVNPAEIASIREVIFQEGKVISFIKERAVNSNWDLAFLTFGYQLVLLLEILDKKNVAKDDWFKSKKCLESKHLPELSLLILSLPGRWMPSFAAILGDWPGKSRGQKLMQKLSLRLPGMYGSLAKNSFKPLSPLWKTTRDIFQEWYLGEKKFKEAYHREPAAPGKKGLIFNEKPLLPPEKIKDTLMQLLNEGWLLGIATGRPLNELYPLLESMHIVKLFDCSSIVTADDVQKAEQFLKTEKQAAAFSLGKPHPFSFLKAYWGKEIPEKELLSPRGMRPQPGKCLVVGDSPADLLAAREAGFRFVGVSSGHRGNDGRNILEDSGAQVVLPDITHIPRYLAGRPS